MVDGYAEAALPRHQMVEERHHDTTPSQTGPYEPLIGLPATAPAYVSDMSRETRHTLADFARSNFAGDISVTDAAGNVRKLEDIEAEMIRLAIDKYKGHMTEVARRLGIGRSTLYRKVRELGLEVRES